MLKRIINQKAQNSIAYQINDGAITYGDLIEKSHFFAELLKNQGNDPVIIYGHKSINTFLSIFSCIGANRAYIPIDSCTPKERIKQIINLTQSSLLLTDETIDLDFIECLQLDDLKKYDNNDKKFESTNKIAYIIFTSGSTGIPKGVPISYNNLLNFIEWIKTIKPLDSYNNIKVLNQASFSFDLSVADIFYSINNGHTIIALDKKNQENYNNIFKIINNNEVNLMVITPTFIKLCLVNKEFNEKNYPYLKCLYFCGEQLEPITIKKIYNQFPNIKLINAYGPTEATSAVSAIEITKDMAEENILPVGEVGRFATDINIKNNEIVLSGESVFSGYIGNIVGGYFKENNIDCFNTGDIGFIKDNKLYCKGRIDSQIKYKGYRIELNDIEMNICNIKDVKECVVLAKYLNEYNVKTIKAFVTLEKVHDSSYIKEELKKKIPLYMMPKSIIILDKMPINYNGKIDRKQLSDL